MGLISLGQNLSEIYRKDNVYENEVLCMILSHYSYLFLRSEIF
jgi:hypothetical protein